MDGSDTSATPRIIDPGSEGWPEEPKVTQAEVIAHGELAGVVRLLGRAASDAETAYRLLCKHDQEFSGHRSPEEHAEWQKLSAATWETHRQTQAAYLETVQTATGMQSERAKRHGEVVGA